METDWKKFNYIIILSRQWIHILILNLKVDLIYQFNVFPTFQSSKKKNIRKINCDISNTTILLYKSDTDNVMKRTLSEQSTGVGT